MRCDTASYLLDALVDRELGRWKRRLVVRHLEHCPRCRAELDAVQATTAQVRSAPAPRAPGALRDRLELATRAPSERPRGTAGPVARPRRLRMAAVLASLALLAVAAVLLFTPARPNLAFAAVSSQMRQVRMASWHCESVGFEDDGKTLSHHSIMDVWYQAYPAAYAEHCTYYWFRENRDNSRDQWTLYSSAGARIAELRGQTWRTWAYWPPESWESDLGTDDLMAKVLAPPHSGGQAAALERAAPFRWSAWDSGAERIDGRMVARYGRRARFTYSISGPGQGALAKPQVHDLEMRETLWADPKTRLILLRQMVEASVRTGRVVYRTVCTGFRYGSPADGLAFRWPRVPGAQVTVNSSRRQAGVWSRMPAAERARVQDLLSKLDRAWSAGESAQLEAVCDFGYLPRVGRRGVSERELRSQCVGRIEAERGRWRTWHTAVGDVSRQDYVYTEQFGALYVPAGEPELLAVSAKVVAVGADGGTGEGRGAIYLRSVPSGALRIVAYTPPSLHAVAAHGGPSAP